tara:strand:- start:39817 stop:40575 length:759 start_codon:yes stop_codon:yes gene_type:complete
MRRFLALPVLLLGLPIAFLLGCGDASSSPADNSPSVTLVSPNGGEFAQAQTIAWRARDIDDGDLLTIDLELLILDENDEVQSSEVLATELENFVGEASATFVWDRENVARVDASGDPIRYSIRVIATDLAGNVASDQSDEAVTLLAADALDNLDWDDVGPIFKRYCGNCHSEPAVANNIDYFRLDKYNADDPEPPTNTDDGVFEMRGAIEQQLLQLGTMPPMGNSQPSDVDTLRIERWLNDGAPFRVAQPKN